MITKEGWRSVYKGAGAPAVGWAISDAWLMGSVHTYRMFLGSQPLFQRHKPGSDPYPAGSTTAPATINLSLPGHALAGGMAGMTVCLVATPTELLKSKLQMQRHAVGSTEHRRFTGPIDCARQIVRHSGPLGLWHGFGSTLLFRRCVSIRRLTDARSWFAAFFSAYCFAAASS